MWIGLSFICSFIHWATNNCYTQVYPLATTVLGNGETSTIGFLLSCICRLKENTNGKTGNNKRFGKCYSGISDGLKYLRGTWGRVSEKIFWKRILAIT